MSNATKPDFVKLARDANPTLRERNAGHPRRARITRTNPLKTQRNYGGLLMGEQTTDFFL